MNHKYENPNPVLKMQISIEVFPAPTYAELCAMQAELRTGPINEDKLAFMDAINREFNRCTPKPAWMRRPNESSEPLPPTQHARIDGAQVNELKGILKPETLRQTFISVPALMAQIQVDIQSKVDIRAAIQAAIQAEIRAKAAKAAKAAQEAAAKAAQEAQEAPKTQAEMDAEAEAELLQARRL
jgi:post-segregation antitoxin (ccd killing protein)